MTDTVRYYRSRDGAIVHHYTCRYSSTGAPWWFCEREQLTDADVAALVRDTPWLRFGKCCAPKEHL